jgi:hypothetical protein
MSVTIGTPQTNPVERIRRSFAALCERLGQFATAVHEWAERQRVGTKPAGLLRSVDCTTSSSAAIVDSSAPASFASPATS